jgi:DNA-binding transcriptional regulator YiaG
MPNIGALLREEIVRLSRRASRAQLDALKKTSAEQRRHIATLRRELAQLARQVSALARSSARSEASTRTTAPVTRVRFVAKGLRSHRERLALSQADFAKLVGVSAQSIYQWERGATRPRPPQLGALAALRGIGKREAHRRLAQLVSSPARKRRRSR